MRTELFTQIPFGVARVKAASPVNNANREYARADAIAESTSRNLSQSTTNERAKELEKAVDSINSDFKSQNIELNFSRDDKTGIVVMKLVDSNTGDSLKQIPSEVSLRLAEAFSKLQIHLVNSEV